MLDATNTGQGFHTTQEKQHEDQQGTNTTMTIPENALISNSAFLEGIMGEYFRAAHCTGFVEDPGQLDQLDLRHYWGGTIWARNPIENPDQNNFFTISTFYPDPEDGQNRRRKANFAAAFCMMIDDIGWGESAKISDIDMLQFDIKPSWRIETSPGNFQHGYIFDYPVMDRAQIEALLKGLVALGLVDGGADPGMLGCTRYARLPVGSNTKARYTVPFRHVLHEWKPDRRYTIEHVAKSFGVPLDYFYREDAYPDALPIDRDPVYQSLDRLGMIKAELRAGIYDIICPWQHQHTEEQDNGCAYLSPMSYKCHHGHCESRTGKDLLNWLHGADPIYAASCVVNMPFVSHEQDAPPPIPEVVPGQLSAFAALDAAITRIVPGMGNTSDEAYELLAMLVSNMTPTEKDWYLRDIKKAANVTISVARDQLKHTRAKMLRDHRKQGILQEPAWKEINEDKIVGCLDNFLAICDYNGITLKYNQMSHSITCDIPGHDFSGEDDANRTLLHMRDLVQTYGIAYARVDEWMIGAAHLNAFHPFRDYLDKIAGLPTDPNTPHFYKVFETLEIDGFEREAEQFVRRWFISIIAAVRGHGGAGMKGVLTFSGPQNIGKTSWLREIFPEGMFREGLVLDPHNKDTLIQATNHLVCELGELDASFKKDIPAIKAFISNQSDEIRHPYAAKSSTHPRRTVFAATVNQTNFLVDQTGNTRFWPVAVTGCDFLAVREMELRGGLAMFWREVDEMYNACIAGNQNFRWWISAEESGLLSEVSERFIRETAGESMLREQYDMDGPCVHWATITEIMQSLGMRMTDHNYVQRKNEALESLRRISGQTTTKKFSRDGKRHNGYKVPQRIMQKIQPQLSVVPGSPFKPSFDFL